MIYIKKDKFVFYLQKNLTNVINHEKTVNVMRYRIPSRMWWRHKKRG